MSDSKKEDRIYFDYAAATPVDPLVMEAMAPYWSQEFGNAGALHQDGLTAKAAVERARKQCADAIGAHSDEIIFTSGGTEGNNFAVFGVVRALEKTGKEIGKKISDMHFITTPLEHSSIRDCFLALKEAGAEVTYLPVDHDGLVDAKDVRNALKENTVLVSVMYVNNEIGTILPISEIGKVIHAYRAKKSAEHKNTYPLFHSDACQAPMNVRCDVEKLHVDLLTIDGQKLYGPKGAGFLYQRRGVPLAPLMHGGNQERGMRPGTPVTPLVAGLGKAMELMYANLEADVKRHTELRDYFFEKIKHELPKAEVNGSLTRRAANNINISIPGFDAEFMLLQLDTRGISISTRSACLFGTEGGSFVVRALGKSAECATSSVRFTLGHGSTKAHIDRTIGILKEIAH